MSWVQLLILVLQLLKEFKGSTTAEFFAAEVQASGKFPTANGDLLKWLWENREQIIEFVLRLIEMFDQQPVTTQDDASEVSELRALVNELRG
jgi:hypothetical protein